MSEIAKCAWCRYEPVKLWGNDRPTTYTCGDVKKDICPSAIQRPLPLDEWNLTQARILEARRKDFEAGWLACDKTVFVDKEMFGSDVERARDFDDYIKAAK